MGRSRDGLTTKIHARVDAKGRPVRLIITPGEAHDVTGAEALLDGLEARAIVIADKDDDIAVSPAALAGLDHWMCPGVEGRIFIRKRVVEALKTALGDAAFAEFRLHRCRVVE